MKIVITTNNNVSQPNILKILQTVGSHLISSDRHMMTNAGVFEMEINEIEGKALLLELNGVGELWQVNFPEGADTIISAWVSIDRSI